MHNTKWNNAQCADGDQVEYNAKQIVRSSVKKCDSAPGLQRLLKCTANALQALDALHFPSARFQTPTTLDQRLNYLRWHSINKGFPSPPAIYLNWHSIKQPIQWFTRSEFTWCYVMGPFSQSVFTTVKNLNKETQEQGSSCIDGRFAYIATQFINTRDVKTDIFFKRL